MGRKVDIEQLVGAAEIADRLSVARPNVVHEWARRHDAFPRPILQLKGVKIWHWPDVERWAKATGRLG